MTDDDDEVVEDAFERMFHLLSKEAKLQSQARVYPVFSGYRRFCFSRPNHKFFQKLRFTKQRMQTAKATHASESFRTLPNHPKIVYLPEFRIKIGGVSDLWFWIAFFEKLIDLLSKECKLRKRSTPLNPIEPDKIWYKKSGGTVFFQTDEANDFCLQRNF